MIFLKNKKFIIIICVVLFIILGIYLLLSKLKETPSNGLDQFKSDFSKDYNKYKKENDKKKTREQAGIEKIYIPKGMEIYDKNNVNLKYKIVKTEKKNLFDSNFVKLTCDIKLPHKGSISDVYRPIDLSGFVFKFKKLDLSINYDPANIDLTAAGYCKTSNDKFFNKLEKQLLESLKVLGEIYYKKNDHKSDYKKFLFDSAYSNATKSDYDPKNSFNYVDPKINPKISERVVSILDEDHIQINSVEFTEDSWQIVCWENKDNKWKIVYFEN